MRRAEGKKAKRGEREKRETNLTKKEILPALVQLFLRVDVSLVLSDEGSESSDVLDVSKEDLGLSVPLLDRSVGGVRSSVKLCRRNS